jgi:7,8-dihydroneopterin aldolase/epimerase/oxygenase
VPEVIRVAGIEAFGRHGAGEEERDRPQRFVVDLEVMVGPSEDDLETTADYRQVVPTARRVIEEESHALIETIAARVASEVVRVAGVMSCRAAVHKPEAARRLGVADVSAEAFAGRSSAP